MDVSSVTDLIQGNPLVAAGAVVGGLLVLYVLAKALFKEKKSEHIQTASCLSCGWRGQVSRYAGRCPKCNDPLGDMKARKK